MSLRRAKTLYCVTMIAVSVLLAAWGGALGCAAGALLLAGALPSWALIGRSWKETTLTALEQRRRAHATPPTPREERSTPLDRADIPGANHR